MQEKSKLPFHFILVLSQF